jgi:hypothetical protein
MARNLSIPSKLIVLLSVPVTGAVLLGVAAVAGGFGERARAGQEVRVAAAAGQAAAAAHELQEERVRAVAWLVTGGRAGQAELAARRRRADRALAAYRAAAAGLGRTGDPGLDQALAEAGAAWTASRWSGPRPTAAWSLPSSPAAATTPWSTPSWR